MILGITRSRFHVPLQTLGVVLSLCGNYLGHHHAGREFHTTAHSHMASYLWWYLMSQTAMGVFLKLHVLEGTAVRRAVVKAHGIVGKSFPVFGWTQMIFGCALLQSLSPRLPASRADASSPHPQRHRGARLLLWRARRTVRCALHHGCACRVESCPCAGTHGSLARRICLHRLRRDPRPHDARRRDLPRTAAHGARVHRLVGHHALGCVCRSESSGQPSESS